MLQTLHLPQRKGEKPITNYRTPHLQFSDTSPKEIYDKMAEWTFETLPMVLATVREHPTLISVPTSRALWLDESVSANTDAFMPPPGSREFYHLHLDGSAHLVVSEEIKNEILEKSWGEPHVLHHLGVKAVMTYAPRDEEEMNIIKTIILKSYEYATGVKVAMDKFL